MIIYYTYDAAGNRTSMVTTGNAAPTVRLIGDLNFGNVQVSNSANRVLSVCNDGNAPLNVTSIYYPNGFSGYWLGTVPAGSTQTVSVLFAPTHPWVYSGYLSVSGDNGNYSIKVTGMGTTSPTTNMICQDDFNNNVINTSAWTVQGNVVQEANGMMNVLTTVTDAGGMLNSTDLPINRTGIIIITRKVYLHYANSTFVGLFQVKAGSLGTFGVYYANMDYSSPPVLSSCHGFYLGRNDATPHQYSRLADTTGPVSALWDQWFNEKLIYDPVSGQLAYYINDIHQLDFAVGALPADGPATLSLTINAWGWYTGHQQLFDDLQIVQITGGTTLPVPALPWLQILLLDK